MAGRRLTDWDVHEILRKVRDRPSSELESEQLEFKGYKSEQALHNSKDLAEELSALANRAGGAVVIGVKDDTDISGSDWASQLEGISPVDSLKTKERLSGKLNPKQELFVRNVPFEGKTFVVIEIAHPRDTLVSTASGKTCIREGRSSRPMAPEEIERAVKALVTFDWSADPIELNPEDGLDPNAVAQALKDFCDRRRVAEPVDVPSFLEAIGATRDGVLVKAGLLFLGRPDVIHRELGDFEYRFSWKTRNGQLLINDVWSGCLWFAVGRAREHFINCNTIEKFQYKDKEFSAPLLDQVAFHEAYLNALVHRDYSSDGMVSVNFTGEKIVITSPGTFYGGVTADNIAVHEPRHRNKALARTLMTHNLVDRAGMGVLRMGIGSLRYGRRFPDFHEAPDSVEVSMEAQFLKAPIAVMAMDHADHYGIPELLILNHVHEKGSVPVAELETQLGRLVESPWRAIVTAVDNLEPVELCGTPSGVFVRVLPSWKAYLQVDRLFRPSVNSEKHVALYSYLKRHAEASNADIRPVLGHAYSSQTSRFLKDAKSLSRKAL
jgi:ATP-dependent DNA helicase RecG